MCNEIGVPLARFRLASDRDELEEKWTELSTYDTGEQRVKVMNLTGPKENRELWRVKPLKPIAVNLKVALVSPSSFWCHKSCFHPLG
jgi:hypothetical protein